MLLTPYMLYLSENQDKVQIALNSLLKKYQVEGVGNGYIDQILSVEKSIILIKELTALNIAVECLSWWCLTTKESRSRLGCPHGMGGPKNRYGEGYFSECDHYPFTSFEVVEANLQSHYISPENCARECNQKFMHYLINDFLAEGFYSECLHPGLWLAVPEDWKSLE
jgi:hypothetical protein